MSTSISPAELTADELRAALELVREGIEIPYAATVGDDETRAKILNERTMDVMVMVRSLLDGPVPLGAARELDYCRERLAEHPATGYRQSA